MGKGNKPVYYAERESPHYLTIYRPYPMNVSMDIEADRMVFAYWVASCIGRENLLAFFHKPKSPSMVIIEVMPSFTDFKVILGEHSWAKFLRKPNAQEKTMCSQVFHCRYPTMRDVEKYGWKRIDLKDEWFISQENVAKWHRINNVITYPYPPTSRCEPPQEDPTRDNLCRPLPVKDFPAPPPARPPPVGSPAWQKQRELEALTKRSGTRRADAPIAAPEPVYASVPRNLAGWAQDRAPAAQGSLPPGLVPSPVVSPVAPSPSSSRWSAGPPGLERGSGQSGSGSGSGSRSGSGIGNRTGSGIGNGSGSGSDSAQSQSSGPPATPLDAPARTASIATSTSLDYGEQSDESDEVEFIGVPTVGNVLNTGPEVREEEEPEEPPFIVPPWVSQPEKVKPIGPVFKCAAHPGGCKPAICIDHKVWEHQHGLKSNGETGGYGSRRANPSTEPTTGGRKGAKTNKGARGRTRDSPPHLARKRSESRSTSADDDDDTDDASQHSSEQSGPRVSRPRAPQPVTKARPNFEPAEDRPAHLLNRGAAPKSTAKPKPKPRSTTSPPTSVRTDTPNSSTAPARPVSLSKQQRGKGAETPPPPAHLRKGKQGATAAGSEPATPSTPSLSDAVNQWRDSVRGGAPSEAGGDDVRSEVGGVDYDARSEDNWGNASTGSSIWPGRKDGAKDQKGDAHDVDENAGATEDADEPAVAWGQTPAPSERGAADDAQSVGGWDSVSMGESQWGEVHAPAPKRNQYKKTPFFTPQPSQQTNCGGGAAPSVSGWSAVSKGEGQWPGVEPAQKDDDAVSVASTVGPGNVQKHAAAATTGDQKGKGKGNNKKNKNKNKKNQNNAQRLHAQVPLQNAGRGAPAVPWAKPNGPAARPPAAPWARLNGPAARAPAPSAQRPFTKPANAKPASGQGQKMSWADQMDVEDDSRSVVSQGWSKMAW